MVKTQLSEKLRTMLMLPPLAKNLSNYVEEINIDCSFIEEIYGMVS